MDSKSYLIRDCLNQVMLKLSLNEFCVEHIYILNVKCKYCLYYFFLFFQQLTFFESVSSS